LDAYWAIDDEETLETTRFELDCGIPVLSAPG